MWRLLALCALLVQSTTKIKYLFTYNYDTQVEDLSGNGNHGEKPASGTSTAVNTPYGLYLDDQSVKLPPNSYAGAGVNNVIALSQDFSISMFLRYLEGPTGLFDRDLLSLERPGLGVPFHYLSIFQTFDISNGPPSFTLLANFGLIPSSLTSSTFSLSKAYLDKWYFFVVSVDSSTFTSNVQMCINGGTTLAMTHLSANSQDFSVNRLNGGDTKTIYYSFQFEDTAQPCSFFDGEFDLGSCSYVCFEGGESPFDVDTYKYDATGTDCGASCGNYGCVNSSPLECYTSTCPPVTYNDASCSSCYANSVKTPSSDSCSCKGGYTQIATHPLTCDCSTSVSTAYSNAICSNCFPHSIQDTTAGTCSCDSGYFNSASTSVVCSGKT
jgi:hypothetical protein